MIGSEDLTNRFTYHPPADEKAATKYVHIRNAGLTLATLIDGQAPDGREKALAITKIEEAVMWANAAIARGTV